MTVWTYRKHFTVGASNGEVRIRAEMAGLTSELLIDGEPRDQDFTPNFGPDAIRNHRLVAILADGSTLEVEAGYRNLWDTAIMVRCDGTLIHESNPGAVIAYPRRMGKMVASGSAQDPQQWERNKLPLAVDIGSGLFFFVVAKLTNLTTAALAAAALAIVLVVLQRITKKDLTGGMVLFGVVMTLIAAGLALAFQSDEAVKWRSTAVGLIAATFFFADGLLNRGRWIGKGLARYMPYAVDNRRLVTGMGFSALAMALLNLAAMGALSTDGWLVYHTFLDNFVAMGLVLAALTWAREKEPVVPEPSGEAGP
jgi:intracellular septation protein A